MRVVCALSAGNVLTADVLVLPEGVPHADLIDATTRLPDALIVGASVEGDYMRAFVMRSGKNRIDFLKTMPDGRSEPYREPQNLPICIEDGLVVGVMVCLDYSNHTLRDQMLSRLRDLADGRVPLLCIPADMNGDFFQMEPVRTFPGVFVALSNNRLTYDNAWRCRSFIADRDGAFIARQSDYEDIDADLH